MWKPKRVRGSRVTRTPQRMKLISVVSSCYNEEENVELLYEAVKAVFAGLPQYRYEHILVDIASKDRTAERLRTPATRDTRRSSLGYSTPFETGITVPLLENERINF